MTAKSSAKTAARKSTRPARVKVAEAPAEAAPPAPVEVIGPIRVAAPTPPVGLLGEIITWGCAGAVQHTALVEALRACGLDESVARELAPRHAFTRACKKLSEDRIIRQTEEDGATITFQFTRESKVGGQFEYAIDTMLTLDKKTGKVTCEKAELADRAQAELDRCIAARTATDVTNCIQKLFDRHADLFPVRKQGGCYFVPARFAEFVERVERFVTGLNGTLGRFPIPAGTPHGNRSVREAVAEGLADAIRDHRAAVEAFGSDTRTTTFERAAEKIRETRFKVESYAEYLGDVKARLEEELAESVIKLRERVAALAAVEPCFLVESDDAWAKGETEGEAVAELWRAAEYADGAAVAYKVWKVHPDTVVTETGKFVVPAQGGKPEFVREVGGAGAAPEPAAEPEPTGNAGSENGGDGPDLYSDME